MRIRLRLIPILLFTLACCSGSDDPKPEPPTESYIRFKIDGVSTEYKESAFSSYKFVDDGDDSYYLGQLYANLNDEDDKDVFAIFISDNEDAKVGKGYDLQNNVVVALPQVSMSHFDSDGQSYIAQFKKSAIIDRGDQAKLTFTEITGKYMKGTFTATLVDGIVPGPYTLRVITNGEFMLNRID
jgi:hypothetical protein